jgi:hypothetical protein
VEAKNTRSYNPINPEVLMHFWVFVMFYGLLSCPSMDWC